MNILVLSDLPQFVRGGAEVQAARLAVAWIDAGNQVRCLGRGMTGNEVTLEQHRIVVARIGTISGLGRWARGLTFFGSLSWLLLQHRSWADVIYCRFLGDAAATAAVLKALGLLSVPLIATPANVGGKGDARYLQSVPGWRRLVGLLDRHVDAINLIAPDMVRELRNLGFSGTNFHQIPNGIPVRRLDSLSSRKRQWILVGRLTPQKGVDVLIQALSSIPVPQNAPDILIVGDGPERERLAEMAGETEWRQRLHLVGSLTPEDVHRKLAESQLFLLPSRYEGMSNAGLEAMERGLPVLLSRCGGLDHYVTSHHGWVVLPGDFDSLRQALLDALHASSGYLASMGAACRQLVTDTFEMSSVASRYLDLFADAVGRRADAKSS